MPYSEQELSRRTDLLTQWRNQVEAKRVRMKKQYALRTGMAFALILLGFLLLVAATVGIIIVLGWFVEAIGGWLFAKFMIQWRKL